MLQMLRHEYKATVFDAAGPDGAGGCPNLAEPPRARRRAYSRWPYPGLRSPPTHQSSGGYPAKRLVQLCRLPVVRRDVRRIVTADLALVALGPYFMWVLKRVDVADMPWRWEAPALATVLCWLLGPAFIFGRDLNSLLSSQRVANGDPSLKCSDRSRRQEPMLRAR